MPSLQVQHGHCPCDLGPNLGAQGIGGDHFRARAAQFFGQGQYWREQHRAQMTLGVMANIVEVEDVSQDAIYPCSILGAGAHHASDQRACRV